MITPQDKQLLLSWKEKISNEINLTFLFSNDTDLSRPLNDFCDILSKLLPKIVIQRHKAKDEQMPSIRIGDRLRYLAVPLGPELEPFMEAAVFQEKISQNPSEPLKKLVSDLGIPTPIKLYISPHCPYCPDTVRKLSTLPIHCELVYLSIIDGTLFPKLAESDGIKSAPTVILDEFRWTGSIKLEEIVHMILRRDPSQLSSLTIRNLIEEGSALQVAQLMLKHQIIFPGLIDLLTDNKWPVRLGAMVVVEELAEMDPVLASRLIAPLWNRFNALEDQTKGDVLYIIGEIGTSGTVPVLERMVEESSGEEIKTIAKEAIECILSRLK